MALAMVVLTVVPESKLIKLLTHAPWVVKAFAKVLRYVAEGAHIHVGPGIAEMAARLLCAGRRAIGLACAHCFPAGTLVATLGGGMVAIQTLRVGQPVLAEDPTTGLVAPEAVQAVLADPVSPLLAVDLSDGSAITATADHPFWVDTGALFAGHNWLAAGDLLAGDQLRTAGGKDVVVVRVRRGVGRAAVYTLTVAKDHTFSSENSCR